jgi:hypothetical protein
MRNIHILAVFFVVVLFFSSGIPSSDIVLTGRQPEISIDNKGIVRVVFGRNDSILCATSTDFGSSFSNPVFIDHVSGMHLGTTRGPQITSSINYSIVTAMDKSGNIHFYQLNHASKRWVSKGLVNDIEHSAPEGLMSIAGDNQDNFYAVWLDQRQGKKNNICFSSLSSKGDRWTKNVLIYTSPDEHVCECCKPNIAVNGVQVQVMFRNLLNGSRDLYLMESVNKGKTFEIPKKLGSGTWKFNGCTMDGGGIAIDNSNNVHTVWQRQGMIYYCKPNGNETQLTSGRSCSISTNNNAKSKKLIVTMQEGETVKAMNIDDKKEFTIGKGSYLKAIILPDESVLYVWEQDKKIKFKKI